MIAKKSLITVKIVKPINAVFLLIGILTIVAVVKIGTPYMLVATVAYALMVMGLFFRHQKQIHYRLMSTSITLDLLIVIILEFSRHAVETAAAMTLPIMQQAHILASLIAVLLYFPIVTLGILRLNGNTSPKVWSAHKTIGFTAFIFRTIGFLLMFSMLKK